MNQTDPTYLTDHEADPAQHVAVDDDLLDVRLAPEPSDWRALCDDDPPPLTHAQAMRIWARIAEAIDAKRQARVVLP